MNVDWDKSDLDLFVKPEDVDTVKDRLLSSGYFLNKSLEIYDGMKVHAGMKVHKFGKYSEEQFPYGPLYNDVTGEKMIQPTRPRTLKVDVIEVCIPYEEFFESFDFDICTSRYDGKDFIIENYENAKNGITKIINNTR